MRPDALGVLWPILVERALNRDPAAYQDLYLLLNDFRQCFRHHLFPDAEEAYSDFVTEIVDRIRYGLLRNPNSLWVQARISALRKTSDRVRSLTEAARILSTIPGRDRTVLIRSQLALYPSTQHRWHGHGVLERPPHTPGESARGKSGLSALRKPIVFETSRASHRVTAAAAV